MLTGQGSPLVGIVYLCGELVVISMLPEAVASLSGIGRWPSKFNSFRRLDPDVGPVLWLPLQSRAASF